MQLVAVHKKLYFFYYKSHGNLYQVLAMFQAPPSFPSVAVWKSGRGPGIFSYMSDVRIERMVERVYLCVSVLGLE